MLCFFGEAIIWGIPKIGGLYLGAPIIRTI